MIKEELLRFNVVDDDGETTFPTVVTLHSCGMTGYSLIAIAQTNADGSVDSVVLGRDQLAAMAALAKGH